MSQIRSIFVVLGLAVAFLVVPKTVLASPPENAVAELSVPGAKDRPSYDRALTQLDDLMKAKKTVSSFEDAVDKFQAYRVGISRQEIGETLFNMYSKVGPRPSVRYFGDRAVQAEEAAAKIKSQKEAEAAAAVARKKAAISPPTRTYQNSQGNTVPSPNADSAGASAKCVDGTYSHSQSRRGTCSYHGGVAVWY